MLICDWKPDIFSSAALLTDEGQTSKLFFQESRGTGRARSTAEVSNLFWLHIQATMGSTFLLLFSLLSFFLVQGCQYYVSPFLLLHH